MHAVTFLLELSMVVLGLSSKLNAHRLLIGV